MKYRFQFHLIFMVIGILWAASACNLKPERHDSAPTKTPTSIKLSSQITATSIQELAKYSDIIVIARALAEEGVINSARDPSDPSKPDKRFFSGGQVYQLEVERYLKGEGANAINVVEFFGSMELDPVGVIPSASEIKQMFIENAGREFIPITLERRYLMFLRVLDPLDYELDGYQSGSLYIGVLGTMSPWRFDLSDPEHVVAESPLQDAERLFPPRSLDSLKYQIEHPEFIPTPVNPRTGTGYPAPTTTPYP